MWWRAPLNINLIYRKNISGNINDIPFTFHNLKVLKGYWFTFLLMIFLFDAIYYQVMLLLSVVSYFLLTYFKGDYYFFNFESPFPFTAYHKNHHFVKKEIKNLKQQRIENIVIYTDNIYSSKTYINKEFLQIIDAIAKLGIKVEFAFHEYQFHLALDYKKSLLSNSTWIHLEEQIKIFSKVNTYLKHLIEIIYQKKGIEEITKNDN